MMKLILLLIITIDVFAYGSSLTKANMENHKNICKGRSMAVGHPHAHLVSLQYRRSHMCGGSILTPNTVLTASHCLTQCSLFIYDFSVVAGITHLNITKNSVRYLIKKCIMHQCYNDKTIDNDIALIITASPIKFGPSVQPIKLCMQVTAAKTCITAGWGTDRLNGTAVNTLQELTTTTITATHCNILHRGKYPAINDQTQQCVTVPNCTGVCKGDSGGSLVCDCGLCGVVSFGCGCAMGFPIVYAKVCGFRSWVCQMHDTHGIPFIW